MSTAEKPQAIHAKVIDGLQRLRALPAGGELPVVIVTDRDPRTLRLDGVATTFTELPSASADGVAGPRTFRSFVTLRVEPGRDGAAKAANLLQQVAGIAGVLAIEAAPGLTPDLYYSIPEIQARRNPPDSTSDVPDVGGQAQTGTGVIVGIVDFGFDYAHPNFVKSNGTSRTIAIWDQNDNAAPYPPPDDFKPLAGPPALWLGESAPNTLYPLSHVYFRSDADRVAAGVAAGSGGGTYLDDHVGAANPYLNYYDPHANYYLDGDPKDVVAHGTHVADIAAGNGRSRTARPGVAPDADIVFVQVRKPTLTDFKVNAANVLNAIHFIFALADKLQKPAVVNLSMNLYSGPHDGSGLFSKTLNDLVSDATFGGNTYPRMIVVSAGNAYGLYQHARIVTVPTTGDEEVVRWQMRKDDPTDNVLTIWYNAGTTGNDKMRVAVRAPKFLQAAVQPATAGETEAAVPIKDKAGTTVGTIEGTRPRIGGKRAIRIRMQSLAGTANTGAKPAVNVCLLWTDNTVARKRGHAWIERDDLQGQGKWQSVLAPGDRSDAEVKDDARQTLGDFACAPNVISVGAFYAPTENAPGGADDKLDRPLLDASSAGPPVDYATLDDNSSSAGFGADQPFLIAPGVAVSAARSKGGRPVDPTNVNSALYPISAVMSGTSMAAPHVAGAVAVLLQKNKQLGTPRGFATIKTVLKNGAYPVPTAFDERRGFGRLNLMKAHNLLA